jgi:hypothetical protein
MKRYIISGLVAASLAVPALAANDTPKGNGNGNGRKPVVAATAQARSEAVKSARLDAAKKRSCDNKERSIKQRSSNFVRHAENHLAVFDKISTRTQKFAEEKNRKPANYDELVAAVDTAREQAVEDIESFKNSSQDFDCDGDNPRAAGRVLQEEAKLVRASLKEYRTAIRNLIVGVKSSKKAQEGTSE